MRRGLALGLLLGWLLGVGTGLLGVALTGGWYEYRLVSVPRFGGASPPLDLINTQGWQLERVVQNADRGDQYYLRRPRFRLP